MSIPVLKAAQMREWEQQSWKAGRSQLEVIRRVGHLVAERAHKMLRKGDSVVALYGRGNNGQDVLQACRLFVEHEVHRVEAIHPKQTLVEFEAVLKQKPALILDGIFGTGLSRPLDSDFQRLVDGMNHSGVPILAVDLPSGLDADTGEPAGAAVRAEVTLTLGAPKRGLLASQAWPYVGRLEVAPHIGLIDCPYTSDLYWSLASDFRHFPPSRPAAGHKGTFGHVAVLAGSYGYHGAAVLAARGAQRAHVGLVTVLTCPEIYLPVASQLSSAMVRSWTEDSVIPDRCTSVVVGPGLADPSYQEKFQKVIQNLWSSLTLPLVVDASGLDALISVPPAPTGSLRVVTPHLGEAARLLNKSTSEVSANRLEAVREISRRLGGAWVVLKGYQTLIGRAEGEIYVNSSGNPSLAQGGSGDFLAGWLGGLLGQPALARDPGKTIRYGVWRHGSMADELEVHQPHWTIEDLSRMPASPPSAPDNRPAVVLED